MTSLTGLSLTHLSRVWSHASFIEEIGPVVCSRAGDPQLGAYLLCRRHGGPSLLFPVRELGREFIHKNVIPSMKKSHLVIYG